MNREQTIEAIKVMQAFVDGKTIQFKSPICEKWIDLSGKIYTGEPLWDWAKANYRIKPAPQERWIVTDGAGNETLYFHDPRPGLAVLETAAKFVEVMEAEAKGASIPAVNAVPPQHLPGTGPLVIGDRVQFTGSLQGIPKGSLATVTAANPTDPTVGVEFDSGQRHKGFTVWRTSLERVNDPSPPEEYDHAF